jgi:hypothetical protein
VLGDTNFSIVLATMVKELLTGQNLIGVRRSQPVVGPNDRYSSIARAIAIVGWSAVTNRPNVAGVLPNWLSKGHGVGRGLREAEWDPFAKKGPKNKGVESQTRLRVFP